jgi:gas vesicle protein
MIINLGSFIFGVGIGLIVGLVLGILARNYKHKNHSQEAKLNKNQSGSSPDTQSQDGSLGDEEQGDKTSFRSPDSLMGEEK